MLQENIFSKMKTNYKTTHGLITQKVFIKWAKKKKKPIQLCKAKHLKLSKRKGSLNENM